MSYYDEKIKKLSIIPRLIAEAPHSGAIVVLQCLSGFFSVVGIPLLIPVLDYLKDGAVIQSKILLHLEKVLSSVGIPVGFGSVLCVAGILFILGQVLMTVSSLIAVYGQAELGRKYRYSLLEGYGNVDWLWLLDARSGDLNYSVLRKVDMASLAHLSSQRVVIYFIQMAVFLAIALKLSWSVTLMAAGVYGVIAVINIMISKRIMRSAAEYHSRFTHVANDLVMLQQNKKFFKTSLLNARMTGGVKSLVDRIAYLNKHETFLMELQRVIGMVLTFSFLLAVMYLHEPLKLDYSELLVVLFIFSRIAPNFTLLTTAFATIDSALPAYESVRNTLDELASNKESNGQREFRTDAFITFQDVKFVYPSGKRVFEGLNMTIAPRTTTAFIGSSGVGKSTLLDLILGLLRPSSGTIYYGDIGHIELDKSSIRKRTAYVSQETTLINGTLRENLSIRAEGSESEMESILKKVGLDEVVRNLPQGLDTQIGENGVKLSGGQRQRVALARALFMDPEILILDEATSNLDMDSELTILETIKKLKGEYTILIVTHRVSSVRFADKIYVLDEGKVREAGSYSELFTQQGETLKQG